LKTHIKTALLVREEGQDVNLDSHVGTGNYHSETAEGYVDLGLLTADRYIGQDLVTLFNSVTGSGLDKRWMLTVMVPAGATFLYRGFGALGERVVTFLRADTCPHQAPSARASTRPEYVSTDMLGMSGSPALTRGQYSEVVSETSSESSHIQW